MPYEAGFGACAATVERDGVAGSVRMVAEGATVRELTDLDGDGRPEEQRILTLDSERRIVVIEHADTAGAVRSRETRTWDGVRLVRREIDKLDARGRQGVDGAADEIHTLEWVGDALHSEHVDQVDGDGLLGVDGTPDLATTWSVEGGKHVVGTTRDVRDGAVLQVERLTWDGDRVAKREIDLGGDGGADATVVNTWQRSKLARVDVDGKLGASRITYRYCD